MTDMFPFMGLMILALVCVMLCQIFAGVWTYQDAKPRGLNPVAWTLIVVLVPNFLGLLIYVLGPRKEQRRICPACGEGIPMRNFYCGNCGAPMEPARAVPPRSGPKGLIVGFFICFILAIGLMFGSVVGLIVGGGLGDDWTPSVSTVYIETHWGDRWDVDFHYTNKTPDHSFRLKEGGAATLTFQGTCKEGPLTLRVWQGDVERTFDLSGGAEVTGSLDLSIFQPGKIYLALDNNKGEGRSVSFHAEWN